MKVSCVTQNCCIKLKVNNKSLCTTPHYSAKEKRKKKKGLENPKLKPHNVLKPIAKLHNIIFDSSIIGNDFTLTIRVIHLQRRQ
jgi:hypothetical protein